VREGEGLGDGKGGVYIACMAGDGE